MALSMFVSGEMVYCRVVALSSVETRMSMDRAVVVLRMIHGLAVPLVSLVVLTVVAVTIALVLVAASMRWWFWLAVGWHARGHGRWRGRQICHSNANHRGEGAV